MALVLNGAIGQLIEAYNGSAVMIKSQNGPNLERSENSVPVFSSCSFHKNSVIHTYQWLWQK